ncbi:AraC family transcriptional regulator [Flavitalea sp. BT771]|uniref:helix-turn-helix domain-containing protein n=1 Tax=Flavitalea sp. BT771 TaxID=3063329 RepID=UPI0026E21BD9|nr:AraC family transcriptional regulator [Flavitalea sp. BT771]MDO6429279.1 AraC family transcriptional regulator [Flavitalea sp. BT771]MDV6218593.1 AraC family transcriptional regulator [Flavitalea sp. BT771]
MLPLRVILHEFPDLGWLKGQIARGFDDRQGWGNRRLETAGFPSVIIHTISHECYRPDIKGPFSFFLNLRGDSRCTVDGQTSRIGEGSYFISNQAQPYTLQVEKGAETETFNIHFGEYFAESVLHSMITPADRILDQGTDKQMTPVSFFNQLHRRDAVFDTLIQQIIQSNTQHGFNKLLFEEQLTALLAHHLRQHRHIMEAVHKLPAVRLSTRLQVYKQLARAIDLIHDSLGEALTLEALAREACLSKYHFLRLFRVAYGSSPHQYIQQLRMEKGRFVLSQTDIPISDVADSLGFVNSQSFSRLFAQRLGMSPTTYRALTK